MLRVLGGYFILWSGRLFPREDPKGHKGKKPIGILRKSVPVRSNRIYKVPRAKVFNGLKEQQGNQCGWN